MIFQWKSGAHQAKLDAQAVGERLEALRESFGHITAEDVVDDARPADALLHSAFEWNNQRAAEEYRKVQARDLIRSVNIICEDTTEPTEVRAFVMINDLGEQSYTSVRVAMADPELRSQVLQRALRELRQWQRKYRGLEELADVFSAAERMTQVA